MNVARLALPLQRPGAGPRRRQGGVLTILFALTLPVLLLMAGVALDLARLYQRRVQLQNLADSVALAAARSLNGTAAGVAEAAQQAADAAVLQIYQETKAQWTPAALTFSSDPDLPDEFWLDAAAAAADPAPIRYAKVDTGRQADGRGTLAGTLSKLAGGSGTLQVAARAVAGRSMLPVTPLAICAMGPASSERLNPGGPAEMLMYGFRHGVSYNLLSLNAAFDTDVAEYFLVDPIQDAATPAGQDHTTDSVLTPYICGGNVQLPRVTGARLRLRRPPSFTLSQQLNSRFDVYGAEGAAQSCTASGAPPDTNISQYAGTGAGWMTVAPAGASAAPAPKAAGQRYNTVADRANAPSNTAYGPLWANGPARQSNGSAVSRAQVGLLYPVQAGNAPAIASYPQPPYARTSAPYFAAPGKPGAAGRRMLNIPLLQCPVPGGAEAQVLAVAQFLMVAQASATQVSAEFAGVINERGLAGRVELYR